MTSPTEVAIARDAIRDLAAAYAHAADRGRVDDLIALFAEQGVLELDDGRRLTGRAAIGAFLRETAEAMRTAPTSPGVLRHHVASHHVVVEAPHAARGWAYFAVFTDRGPDHWGRYRDAYVHTRDGWLFASRHVRVDGRASAPASGLGVASS
jgi:hypothetical protein